MLLNATPVNAVDVNGPTFGSGFADPNLRVSGITDAGALLSIDENTDWLSVTFETYEGAVSGSPVDSVTSSAADRFYRSITGRTPLTLHTSRVRYTTALGTSPWFERTWTTLDDGEDPPDEPSVLVWLSPYHGEPVSGAAVSVQVVLPAGVTITLAEIRLGDSGSWTSLGSNPGNPFTFDSTVFTDSASVEDLYVIRLTLSDGSTHEHTGFRIDNGGSTSYWEGPVPQASNLAGWGKIGDVAAAGDPGGYGGYTDQWTGAGGLLRNQSPSIDSNLTSGLVRNDISPTSVGDEMRVTGSIRLHTWGEGIEIVGGGRLAGVEGAVGGLVACGRGTLAGGDFSGVVLDVGAYLMAGAFGIYSCDEVGLAGNGVSRLRVFQGGAEVASSELSIQAWASFIDLILNAPGPYAGAHCSRLHDYPMLLEVRKPDRINFPNRITVLGRVHGGVAVLTFEETFDLASPLLCGYGGYTSNKVAAAGSRGFRIYGPLGIDILYSTGCDTPPTETPDPPGLDASVECDDLTLELLPALEDASPVAVSWLLTTAADTTFANPIYGPGFQSTDLSGILIQDLAAGDYLAKAIVRYAVGDDLETQAIPITIEENLPPGAPTWVAPDVGEIFGPETTEIDAQIAAATDPEDDPLQYEAGYTLDDGDTFIVTHPLGTVTPGEVFVYDVTGFRPGTLALYSRAHDGCQYGPARIRCIEISPPPCPPAEINVTTIRRIEGWSDVWRNGGVRIGFIPDWIEASDHESLDEGTAQILIPKGSPANVAAGVASWLDGMIVLRLIFQDLTWKEMRVSRTDDGRGERNDLTERIELEDIGYDLARRMVTETQSNGRVDGQFPSPDLPTAAQALKIIRCAPGYFVLGDVESSKRVDMNFNWDTCLEALNILVSPQVAERELEVLRDTCGFYGVHIVERKGARWRSPVAVPYAYAGSGLMAVFDGADSTSPTSFITSYTWDFGDNQTGTGSVVAHTYEEAGTYTVTLTVRDAAGQTGSATVSITVGGVGTTGSGGS